MSQLKFSPDPHRDVLFQLGTRIRVKPEYWCDYHPHRQTIGVVVSHVTHLDNNPCDPYTDNMIQFSDGTIEAFGNWEIETVTK